MISNAFEQLTLARAGTFAEARYVPLIMYIKM